MKIKSFFVLLLFALDTFHLYLKIILSYFGHQLSNNHLTKTGTVESKTKQVCFVSEKPAWREPKLAYGLSITDWKVYGVFPVGTKIDEDYFDGIYYYKSYKDLLNYLNSKEFPIIHNFTLNGDLTAFRIALASFTRSKIVIDLYDSMEGVGLDVFSAKLRLHARAFIQRFALKSADAVCARDLQINTGRTRKLRRGKKIILFPEYCWNLPDQEITPKEDDLTFAQIGYIGFETKGQFDVGCLEIVKRLINRGASVHLYIHPHSPKRGTRLFNFVYADYLKLQDECKRFKLMDTVSPRDLNKVMGRYQYGLNVQNHNIIEPNNATHSMAALKRCGSNRVFDYLDANSFLVLGERYRFMVKTFHKFGVSVDIKDLLDVQKTPSIDFDKKYFAKIKIAKEELSIRRQIYRLEKFYDNVVSNGK